MRSDSLNSFAISRKRKVLSGKTLGFELTRRGDTVH